MAKISFKDVGVKNDVARAQFLQQIRTDVPIGIKTPLKLVGGKNLFEVNTSIREQIRDNLRNLLLTNHGERLMFHDFGANIRPLLTEYTNKEDFDTEAMVRINTAITRYLPFIVPVAYDSVPDLRDNLFTGKIRIIVVYSVPALQVVEDVLELELFVI
jgi:phage baseplate assembly protein W